MKLKVAKPCYRYDMWCGSKAFGGPREKSLAQDSMHKPYVRAARNANNLPDAWDDTKFIKRQKSWKHRCKKKKQWMKHIMGALEKVSIGLMTWEEYCE
jgi:hypothetical protein